MATEGLMVYNTIPGSLASSPEHSFHVLYFKKFSLFTFQPAYLPRVDLSFHTNLFRNLDAVWFQHQPGDFGNLLRVSNLSEHEYFYYYSQKFYQKNINYSCGLEMWPRNKDGLHPTIFLGLEIAIFRRDVLNQVLLLVSANLRWHLVLNTWILENSWIFEYLNTWKLEHLNTWILENVSILEYLNTNKYFSINLLCWTNFTIRGRAYLSEKLNNVHK